MIRGLEVRAGPELLIELRLVDKRYAGPPPVVALKGVDLGVDAGEYVAIQGPSGSGKSTLLNVLGLLDRPSDGTYLFDGVDTSTMTERERTAFRAQRVGFMFQAFHLMPHRTVADNVAMPLIYRGVPSRERRRLALEKLELVRLGHRAEAMPTMLSGGEMQRAAIARALVSGPSLLLCDEPTGNLDTATAEVILASIDQLVEQGLTVLTITHDAAVASRAHRSVVIRDGRLESDPA